MWEEVEMEGISVRIQTVGRKEQPPLFCDCITLLPLFSPQHLHLWRFISYQNTSCTHYLILNLFDHIWRISTHQNAFVIAAQEGNLEIVQMLIDRGAEVDTPDKVCYCTFSVWSIWYVISMEEIDRGGRGGREWDCCKYWNAYAA
jgi:hypothetical protein